MITSPPKRLILTEVPRYIRTHYGHDVSKTTIYNWLKVGRKGKTLRIMPANVKNPAGGPHAKVVTTTTWVDEFLKEVTNII